MRMLGSAFLQKQSLSFLAKLNLLKLHTPQFSFLREIVYNQSRDHIFKIQRFRSEPLSSHLFSALPPLQILVTQLYLLSDGIIVFEGPIHML